MLLLVAICIYAMIYGGSCDDDVEEGGIHTVEVSSPIPVDGDSCAYRYDIRFSDVAHDAWYYWVGLGEPKPDGENYRLLAQSQSCDIVDGPFTNHVMSLLLRSGSSTMITREVYGIAVCTVDSNTIGQLDSDNNRYRGVGYDPVFLPVFPDSCPGSGSDPGDPPLPSDLDLRLLCGSEVILQGDPVYITPTPAPSMPLLVARIASAVPEGQACWGLTITYNRSGRTDTMTWPWYQGAEDNWNIWDQWGDSIMGGQALLVCTTLIDGAVGHLPFCIRAKNPPETTVVNFIENLDNAMWYTKYVAKHESGYQDGRYYLQFNEVGSLSCDPEDFKYTPNESGDGGFGLFQLTEFVGEPGGTARVPNTEELWSWQQNAISGAFYLDTLLTEAWQYMLTQRLDANFVPVPEHYVAPVLFRDDGDTTIEHAVALKRYNGLGVLEEEYCWWHSEGYIWKTSDSAVRFDTSGVRHLNYYVRDVCSLVAP